MLSSKAGLKLSGEYEWMRRSFDGIHIGYLVPIKKNAPEITSGSSFPFVEAAVWRPKTRRPRCSRYQGR
jgi:hypothetical protein